jgi:NAD(P)H-hydrate repair Nnr-like enzyme with NAD(P)H-hydrate dehydratase domain
VTAAIRTGIGLVRYFGPESVERLILESRPEVVCEPGRVSAWVLGSGLTALDAERLTSAFAGSEPKIIDAGALEICNFETLEGRAILTPHAGEAAALVSRLDSQIDRAAVEAEPEIIARQLAMLTGQTVCLKGSVTVIANPDFETVSVGPNPADLATAGTGDVLAGIMGAILAAHHDDFDALDVAQTAVLIHAEAAKRLAEHGPIAALDLADEVREVVGDWRT